MNMVIYFLLVCIVAFFKIKVLIKTTETIKAQNYRKTFKLNAQLER